MSTWIKSVPPKMLHDTMGVYHGNWMPEMDRCWIREEDGVTVSSRLVKTPVGNVEHVTITRGDISFEGTGDFTWAEKMAIKNELFGENRAAVEVYPKTKNLVDVCDVYHLWVFDKKYEMPFGIHPREYKAAINRGYNITQSELVTLKEYYENKKPESLMPYRLLQIEENG